MIRARHRWPGLLALALVTILSLSGAALSVFPAAERITAPQAEADHGRFSGRSIVPGCRVLGRPRRDSKKTKKHDNDCVHHRPIIMAAGLSALNGLDPTFNDTATKPP